MNNALDFNNLLVGALIVRADVCFPAIFSKLIISYVFLTKDSYEAAYIKQESCVLPCRANAILWNKLRRIHVIP